MRGATCGQVTASCVCGRKPKHKGPCVCDCTGAWQETKKAFRVFALPGVKDTLSTPEQCERYAATLDTTKAGESKIREKMMATMLDYLGYSEDE